MSRTEISYRDWPETFDVVVVGGGTAGAIAAMAAAREGAKTLICEREYALGGTASLAQTTPHMTLHMTQKVTNSALAIELQNLMIENGFGEGEIWFSPQLIKCALEMMCEKYKVKILYGADLLGVLKTGTRIDAALFQTISGAVAIKSAAFIDASGNASLAEAAGCPVAVGNADGKNQAMTLRFALCNVDVEKTRQFMNGAGIWPDMNLPYLEMASLWKYPADHPMTALFRKAVNDGVLTERDGVYFQSFATACYGDGVMYFNCPEAGHILNALDPAAITDMVLYSRKAALRLQRFLKSYVPGFEHSSIHSFAEIPGIRESRRILGEYVLTEEDYYNCLKRPDAVAQSAYPIDIHSSNHDEGSFRPNTLPRGEFFEIPFATMIPKQADNLLVAGRCISATFVAQSAMRIQLVCMALGEAAGIAAARNPVAGRNDGAEIRRIMIERGGTFA